jgi:hypothetical protein
MIKTLEMELAEYHKELSHFFYDAIYRGELRDWHTDGCAFNDAVDNRCDCVLLEAYKIIKHWGVKP